MAGFYFRLNSLQNRIQIRQHLLIREAQYHQSQTLQELLPNGVLLPAVVVHRSIHFYQQASFSTIEIGNETTNGVLAAKLEPIQPTSSQGLPQYLLGGRGIVAHLAGQRLEHRPQLGVRAKRVIWRRVFISPG